jgi:hypothetical protein
MRKFLTLGCCVIAMLTLPVSRVRAREANQLAIVTGFGAKEACSCIFLSEQTDEYCKDFGQTGAASVELVIDRSAQTVLASYAGTKRIARFVASEGCQVDALP